jgi:hypothetical protein
MEPAGSVVRRCGSHADAHFQQTIPRNGVSRERCAPTSSDASLVHNYGLPTARRRDGDGRPLHLGGQVDWQVVPLDPLSPGINFGYVL